MDSKTGQAVDHLCAVAEVSQSPLNETTNVAVFGVWNAGKSTLIKRLLVELGLPIPDWLTVAGAPETNFVGSITLGPETTFVDTPGISDGMSLHEGEAAKALRLADALIVVLLPSLVTAEKDEILAVLRAQHAHEDGWPWPPHGLRVLVAQLDDFGL